VKNIAASPNAPQFGRTFQVGVLAAAQISIWMSIPFFSIELFLGGLLTSRSNATFTWLLGFVWHLLNGGIFAIIYRAIFRTIGRGGPAVGALLGLGQWLIVGATLPFFTHTHEFTWSNLGGATFVGTLTLHLCFGAIVGLASPSRLQVQMPLSDSEFDSSENYQQAS
jgi:hypothetical protein